MEFLLLEPEEWEISTVVQMSFHQGFGVCLSYKNILPDTQEGIIFVCLGGAWLAVLVPAWKQDFDGCINLRKRYSLLIDVKHSFFKGEVPR